MTDTGKKGVDNNIYKEAFERVTISEERRREILQIPQAGAENAKGRIRGFGRKSFSRVVVCGLILVLITGTAVAVSSGGSLKDWFEEEWRASNGKDMSAEQQGVISSLTTPLDMTQTVGDVTATLDSIAYNDGCFWMLINVEGVSLDPKKGHGFEGFELRAYEKDSSDNDFAGGWGIATQVINDGSQMQVLIDGQLDAEWASKMQGQTVTFEMRLADLTENYYEKKDRKVVQAGEWKFEFSLPLETTGETLTAEESDIKVRNSEGQIITCTVSELELSCVNIKYRIKAENDATQEDIDGIHQETPRIILRDGNEVGIGSGSGSMEPDGSWKMEYQLTMPIDTGDVKAVQIGKTKIAVN